MIQQTSFQAFDREKPDCLLKGPCYSTTHYFYCGADYNPRSNKHGSQSWWAIFANKAEQIILQLYISVGLTDRIFNSNSV